MSRETSFLMVALLSATLLGATVARADSLPDPADEIRSTLEEKGYKIIQDERTWLGRQRVIAVKNDTRRELVFIPGTGEILRDYSVRVADTSRSAENRGVSVSATNGVAVGTGRGGVAPGVTGSAPGISVGEPVGMSADGPSVGAAQE